MIIKCPHSHSLNKHHTELERSLRSISAIYVGLCLSIHPGFLLESTKSLEDLIGIVQNTFINIKFKGFSRTLQNQFLHIQGPNMA